MLSPAVTGSGESTFVSVSSVSVAMVVVVVAVLLVGSVSAEVAVAVLVSVPRCVEATVPLSVIVALPDGLNVPTVQTTCVLLIAHVPCVRVVLLIVTPLGSVSVIFTLVAVEGPVFVIRKV